MQPSFDEDKSNRVHESVQSSQIPLQAIRISPGPDQYIIERKRNLTFVALQSRRGSQSSSGVLEETQREPFLHCDSSSLEEKE